MSYHGKTYKKVKVENILELIEKLQLGENSLKLLKDPETVGYYYKNDDGSVSYKAKKGDQVVLDQTLKDGTESDIKSPEGHQIKIKVKIDGDFIKSIIYLHNGKVMHLDRYFSGNTMKMEVYGDEAPDVKGIVYYEAI